jgi:hypothetical protein
VTSRRRTSFGTAMVGLLKRRHPGTAMHDCVRVGAEKPQLEFRKCNSPHMHADTFCMPLGGSGAPPRVPRRAGACQIT